MVKVAFIIPGHLGHRDRLWSRIDHFLGPSFDVASYTTREPGQGRALARQAFAEGYDHLISVGGDGSLNEVVNGVMDARPASPEAAARQVRVGLLPRGTGNDFARSVELSGSLEELRDLLAAGAGRPVDLGQIRFTDPEGHRRDRYFINIADVGMGGMVVKRTAGAAAVPGKGLPYHRAIVRTFLTFRRPDLRVAADRFEFQGRVTALVIANGRYFGNGLGIAPKARPDDGQFAIVILKKISVWDYLRRRKDLQRCRLMEHPEVLYRSAKELSVEATEDPLPIDMDGEFIGYTPLSANILPGALSIIA